MGNKAKSIQNALSEYLNKSDYHKNNQNNAMPKANDSLNDFEEDIKMEEAKATQIKRLKEEIEELKKQHKNEKTSLLNSIQRLSSKSVQSKGSDMHCLVNNLSNIISEKEEIISAMTESKKYLG